MDNLALKICFFFRFFSFLQQFSIKILLGVFQIKQKGFSKEKKTFVFLFARWRQNLISVKTTKITAYFFIIRLISGLNQNCVLKPKSKMESKNSLYWFLPAKTRTQLAKQIFRHVSAFSFIFFRSTKRIAAFGVFTMSCFIKKWTLKLFKFPCGTTLIFWYFDWTCCMWVLSASMFLEGQESLSINVLNVSVTVTATFAVSGF